MKKFVLSLLTLAATMNIMAVTYSAKATITLESKANYESCQIIIGESDALAEGITNGEAAELNMEGRSVALYVDYDGVKYQNFASNPATMKNLALGVKTNAASEYNLYISDVTGTFTLKIGDAEPFVVTEGSRVITLTPNQSAAAFGIINYVAPVSGFEVTLNGYGLATFSGDQDAEIPANLNLKAYTATYVAMDKVLNLDEITTGKIPANTGVILFGTAGADYTLPYTTGAAAVGTNHLQPATTASVEDVFVLSGNALYQYTGVVPANKAYLQLPGGAPAPARIGLRFGTATAVESVEVEAVKAEKFVENGQVFIRRGEAVYNLQGQLVK